MRKPKKHADAAKFVTEAPQVSGVFPIHFKL
jgi:hypothetical protein